MDPRPLAVRLRTYSQGDKNILFLIISLISSGFGRLPKILLSGNLHLPMALNAHTRVSSHFLGSVNSITFYAQYSLKFSVVLPDFQKRGFGQ